MIKWLLVKFYLYFKGVRFYQTDRSPNTMAFKKSIFKTIDDYNVCFYFYKEIYDDLVYKRGKIYNKKFIGYLIRIDIDNNFPERLRKINNMKIVFSSDLISECTQDEIDKQLLSVYLDFIKKKIKEDK